ncbi:diguanylate cyclase/phosphodiesterase with PAS/PAC sensor [Halorhodospira halochloris]|uniref:Diguanylate cyclase/phosphodiesterase with PAS/PAC sensor n=1 Tax=Halorhodospira halochloris TaxID=1052 RepID=A0A110B595_HALHR|nr:diguanylate cyclase [Halorhodospira halochloris]MBK1652823.1 hypothetical protein [Halorhodospira halochloris]BAU58073.1 diguanylate cyclase/phosphodiesterase with PAS/PAC sensor [Halorhodospira halochloris]
MDIPTLFLIIALTNLLLGAAMLSMADRPGHSPMWLWSLAALVNTLGHLGFMWHANTPHPALLVISNLMLSCWLALIAEGFRLIQQYRLPRWLLWAPLPVMAISLLPILDNMQARVVVVSAILFGQLAMILFMLFRNWADTPGRGRVIVSIGLSALLLLVGYRFTMASLGGMDATTSILQENITQIVTFNGSLLFYILLALGVIVMTQERAGQILAASEKRFRMLFEESRQPLTLMDQQGYFTAANPAALEQFQLPGPDSLIGRPLTDFAPQQQADGRSSSEYAEDMCQQTLRCGGYECEWQCIRPNGQPFDAMLVLTAIHYEEHPILHVAWKDITQRKAIENQLRINEQKFRTFVEDANDIIYALNLDGTFQYISPNISDILGQDPNEIQGSHFSAIVHPDDVPHCETFLQGVLTTRSKASGLEYRVQHKRYGWQWHVTNASPLLDNDNSIMGMLGIAHDITTRKRAETQFMHMAHHDGLTQLPNRALLMDRLDQAMATASANGKMLALMFIDLDQFKPINDTHGHGVGDLVLQQTAQRLLGCLRDTDTVARIGGDEFVVVLPEISRVENAERLAGIIQHSLDKPFHTDGLKLHVSSSIGIAIYPDHGKDGAELTQNADIAMYYAKQSNSQRIQLFSLEMPDLMHPSAAREG